MPSKDFVSLDIHYFEIVCCGETRICPLSHRICPLSHFEQHNSSLAGFRVWIKRLLYDQQVPIAVVCMSLVLRSQNYYKSETTNIH